MSLAALCGTVFLGFAVFLWSINNNTGIFLHLPFFLHCIASRESHHHIDSPSSYTHLGLFALFDHRQLAAPLAASLNAENGAVAHWDGRNLGYLV
jgi:hypothetical protein